MRAASKLLQVSASALVLAAALLLAGAAEEESRLPHAATPAAGLDASQQAIAEMLDDQLYERLSSDWAAVGNAEPFCSADNLSIISVPSGLNVYLVRQDAIPGALNDDGEPASVEDVVFRAEQLYGKTPLTLPLPTGDYVLALRPDGRESGFDGGCVRKAQRDVVTGTLRHTYHLYPFARAAGEYQLFVSSFIDPETPDSEVLAGLAEPWSFHLPEEQLAAAVGQATGAPEALFGRIAMDLNRYGLAFYSDGRRDWLVKLALRGASFELKQWPVEY
ncbi:hypothetical protein IT575_00360 [bacterium]|nr:hypothetical protein [bacterium]